VTSSFTRATWERKARISRRYDRRDTGNRRCDRAELVKHSMDRYLITYITGGKRPKRMDNDGRGFGETEGRETRRSSESPIQRDSWFTSPTVSSRFYLRGSLRARRSSVLFARVIAVNLTSSAAKKSTTKRNYIDAEAFRPWNQADF